MKKTALIMAVAAAGTLMLTGAAFAAGPSMQGKGGTYNRPMMGPGPAMPPGIFGTVTAVNGDTLTVNAMNFRGPHPMNATSSAPIATTTTYTVDATNATVTKNGATSTVSAISVNDKVLVRGTVSGTNITATAINDGVTGNQPGGPIMFRGRFGNGTSSTSTWNNSSTWPTGIRPTGSALTALQGNGEPIVGGTVTAVNGAMFTVVTNTGNVTYSIDGTNATVLKGNATSSVSSVAVNDRVIVQGTVNGTAVTASTIIDQGAAPSKSGNGTSTSPHGMMGGIGGFFGGIGSFFQHLFGFF
jgi:hypothetical protein